MTYSIPPTPVPEERKSVRKRFNDNVRDLGNRLAPAIGVGDILTTDVNFRRIGLAAGALAPLAGYYYFFDSMVDGPAYVEIPINAICSLLAYASTVPLSVGISTALGFMGYRAGNKIDNLLGDKTRRIRMLLPQENKIKEK